MPTRTFNDAWVKWGRFKLWVWDVGGQSTLRTHWRHHYTGTHGIIFIVDSVDTERLHVARDELETALNDDQLEDVSVLVLANKQDVEGAANPAEVAVALGLGASSVASLKTDTEEGGSGKSSKKMGVSFGRNGGIAKDGIRQWKVFGVSAHEGGDQFVEAIDWLCRAMKEI